MTRHTPTATVQTDRQTVVAQLTTPGSDTPVDLRGRDVTFVMRHEDGDKIVDALAEVLNEREGRVSYQLSPTETAQAGEYDLEWIATGGSDDPTTYPRNGLATFTVREDVEADDTVADPLPENRTVDALFVNELNGSVTGDVPVTTIAGTGLEISGGVLSTTGGEPLTQEGVEDIVGAFIAAGQNVSVDYDDANNALTISATDSDTQLSDEQVEDIVGAFVTGEGATTVDYDDGANALTISSTDTQLSADAVRGIISDSNTINVGDGSTTAEVRINSGDAGYSELIFATDGTDRWDFYHDNSNDSFNAYSYALGASVFQGLSDGSFNTPNGEVHSNGDPVVTGDGTARTIRSGTTAPDDSTGEDGDIFIVHD